MARRPKASLGDTTDPAGLAATAEEYLTTLQVRGYSVNTNYTWHKGLRRFIGWCAERSITRPTEVTRDLLERYQRHLYEYRQKNGEPLNVTTQHTYLLPILGYFHGLAKRRDLPFNPAGEIELPRLPNHLPRYVLTAAEAEQLLVLPDVADPYGLRDRAILETFYSTAMRRAELSNLELADLDHERGIVLIREGKGKVDRYVPIGARALAWVDRYIEEVRPTLLDDPTDPRVFVGKQGSGLTPSGTSQIVGGYIRAANLRKVGACHLLRHTAATLMLEGGADIRFIQAILGHAKLETTSIYTRVSVRKLKEIHTATHPSAKLEGAARAEEPTAAEAHPDPVLDREVLAEALLDALKAEAVADPE